MRFRDPTGKMAQALLDNKKKVAEADRALEECVQLEAQFAHLRSSYEMYFLGQERRPPTSAHEALKKKIRLLKESYIQQTAVRFRIDALDTKMSSYERMWQRNLQEMENGTFRRDVARMKRKHDGTPPKPSPEALDAAPTEAMGSRPDDAALGQHVPVATSLGMDALPTLGARPPPPRPVPQDKPQLGPATATASGGLSDDRLKALYNAYLAAKRRCNEDVSKLTFENMAASIKKQVPELMKQHKAQAVDFKVVIKDGKAVLRAVPK